MKKTIMCAFTFILVAFLCGGTQVSASSCSITINSDLSFALENATYATALGNLSISAEFEFFGDQNGQKLWKLKSADPGQSSSCSVSIESDLSFTICDAIYDNTNYWVSYKFYGEQNSILLWYLDDIGLQTGNSCNSNSITINGYTFDENSATLTNKWYPLAVGQTSEWQCPSMGQDVITDDGPTGTEKIFGVNCLKVSGGSHEWWLAEDTVGNIHVFKHVSNKDHESGEINSDDDIPNLYLPSDPITTGNWSWKLDSNVPIEVFYEILDYNSTISEPSVATYTNCLKISEGTPGDNWKIEYLKQDVGSVAIETGNTILCIRLDNNAP